MLLKNRSRVSLHQIKIEDLEKIRIHHIHLLIEPVVFMLNQSIKYVYTTGRFHLGYIRLEYRSQGYRGKSIGERLSFIVLLQPGTV